MRTADWVTLITLGVPVIATAVVQVIQTIRQSATAAKVEALHSEVKPPSNGITNGKLAEDTSYALNWLVRLYAQDRGIVIPPLDTPGRRATDTPITAPVVPPAVP